VANNEEFEGAMKGFIGALYGDAAFLAELEAFVRRVNGAGRVNSLAQTLLKYTSPGVPDLYQGSELWDHSLVDPDNRRPVDYALRRRLLEEVGGLCACDVVVRMEEGLPKLKLIHTALRVRAERPEWFGADAEYAPLAVVGARADCAIAFLRGGSVVTVVPRLTMSAGNDWGQTAILLPAGRWKDRLTESSFDGGEVRVGDLLKDFPVALLTREQGDVRDA
jgi:(1->4)-alpha-D-glucan 1-alpha-D-glucosylmutase